MPSIAARGGRCTAIPTLDRLAAQIDISNQTLMQAEAAYRQARALVRQDASGLYPTVTGSAGYTQSGSGTGSEPRRPGHRGQRELGQRRPVQRRPRRSTGRSTCGAASAARSKAIRRRPRRRAADLANARLSAQANMAINYFSMRISEQRMRVYQASVAAYTRSVEIVQNQLDAGIV